MREDPDVTVAHWRSPEGCHLVITTLDHREQSDSPDELRERMPMVPVLLVEEAIEAGTVTARLPDGFAVLRVPVQVDELRAAVRRLLPMLSSGTVLARRVAEVATVGLAPAVAG